MIGENDIPVDLGTTLLNTGILRDWPLPSADSDKDQCGHSLHRRFT